MNKFERVKNGIKIYAYAERCFDTQIGHLLNSILQINEIHDQTNFKFGSFIYLLSKTSENEYTVLVSDFENNYLQKTKDLSYSLNLIRFTISYSKELNLEPIDFDVMTKILVAKDIIDKDKFICQKFAETNQWEITDLNLNTDFNIEVSAYELLKIHPKLFSLLFLPNEYMILFENTYYTIIDSHDHPVLKIKA